MIALYNSLFGLALALVSFTLAPALFGKVRRRGPWIAQMISWLVYSASYILLAGHQLGPKPPLGICVFQATLVYAVAPLCAASTACNVFDLYNLLHTLLGDAENNRTSTYWMPIMMILPWAIFLAVVVEISIVIAYRGTFVVERAPSGSFCNLVVEGPMITTAVLVLLLAVIMFYVQIRIMMLLKVHWTFIKSCNNSNLYISMFIRTFLLSSLTLLGVGLSFFACLIATKDEAAWSISFPGIPILASLLFGTQKDSIDAWLSWFKYLFHILNVPSFGNSKPVSQGEV